MQASMNACKIPRLFIYLHDLFYFASIENLSTNELRIIESNDAQNIDIPSLVETLPATELY